MRLGIFWQNFGPYHFARLAALRELCAERDHEVFGLEVSERSDTYIWRRTGPEENGIRTLFPGRVAEDVSAWAIRFEARKYLATTRCDVIFTPSYWPLYSLLVAKAAKSIGMRVVMMNESHQLSGNNSPLAFGLKRQIARMYDAAFVGGSVHREFHRELGFAPDAIFDGYDAVDNDRFCAMSDEVRRDAAIWRPRLGLPEKFILNIGRFVAKKNLPVLLQAFALARRNRWLNGCDLVLVGDGPEKPTLLQAAAEQELTTVEGRPEDFVAPSLTGAEMVRFYPFAQIDTVPAYYALAECLILPSLREEWGLVVNEAMASACAVGVSRTVGCAPDLTIPGHTGIEFDPREPEALAEGLKVICQDPALARRLGENARKHVARWSCARFAENALGAANAALTQTPQPGRASHPWSLS